MGGGARDSADQWMARLAAVIGRVARDADRRGVLEALGGGLAEGFAAALARIWLYDPADDALHAQITVGDVRDYSGSSDMIPLAEARWPIAPAMRDLRSPP